MKKSKNEQVNKFLSDMMTLDDEKFNILRKLRDIVFKQHPKVKERIMYGGIMFSLADENINILQFDLCEEDSDDDRPLTRQELDKKTARDFAKKLQLTNQTM